MIFFHSHTCVCVSGGFSRRRSRYSALKSRSKHQHTRVFEIMASSKLISPALRAALNLHSSKLPAATSQLASAHLSSAPSGGKHELPGLKYDYGALERKLDIRFCYIKIQFMSFIRVMVSLFCSLIRCDDAFKTPMRALRREILLWQLENSTQICMLSYFDSNELEMMCCCFSADIKHGHLLNFSTSFYNQPSSPQKQWRSITPNIIKPMSPI